MIFYFFAGFSWIANGGVVPWFLSFAFLLAPCFFNLFARFASVTLVLDTIIMLLFRWRFVPRYAQYVKIFLILPIFTCIGGESWIISKGEHKEIPLQSKAEYSISNKDVVAHKFYKHKKILLIKGKKLGFSELLIRPFKGKARTIQIYVLSKKKQLDILHVAKTLRSIGLQTSMAGPLITVSGEIKNFEDYILAKRLKEKHARFLHIKGSLHSILKKQVIAKVYQILFDQYIDNINCHARFFTIYCQYPINTPPAKSIMELLTKDLFIKLVPVNHPQTLKNYRVNLKLILMEKVDGSEINIGLNNIDTTYKAIFDNGVKALVEENRILLRNQKLDLSTLAEPTILMILGKSANVQVGADIPFNKPISGSDHTTTEWKFAGLKVEMRLEKIGKMLQLSYQTEFTKPSTQGVSGSKQSSSLSLSEDEPTQLFEIGFKSSAISSESLPLLGSIPILGNLFSSKSDQMNYKKIIGVINLE